jgi:ABC-type iron transport system FetAB permease component
MNIIQIITYVLVVVFYVLIGKQIGQEGLKKEMINPNNKAVILIFVVGFFLQLVWQTLKTSPQ